MAAPTSVFLTGGNGFVGSRVAGRLASAGHSVRVLVRRPGESRELRHPAIEEVAGSFTDASDVIRAIAGADRVVHCAATLGQDLEDARAVNVRGTRTVMEAALTAGCRRVVHISTTAVYDYESAGDTIDESSALATKGHPYAVSKAEGDEVVLEFIRRGLPAVILRPPAILGVHPTSTWGIKVPARIRDGQLPLVGDGGNTFSYVHVENLVDAVMLGLDHPEAPGQVFNVVDGGTTWRAFTEEIRAWFGAPPPESTPRDEAGPGAYWTGTIDAAKIRATLGYAPAFDYAAGMTEARETWKREAGEKT
jgi:nucleoside-diphosphate-sugar epimerase